MITDIPLSHHLQDWSRSKAICYLWFYQEQDIDHFTHEVLLPCLNCTLETRELRDFCTIL